MEHSAFTRKFGQKIREIKTHAGIFPVASGKAVIPEKIEALEALWDTGATNTAVSSSAIKKIGSTPITFAQVGTGGGQITAPVHLVNIVLPNNVIVQNIQVTELKDLNNCDILVGMDIISQGDFAITHVNGEACFSFRMPSSKLIDFVPESDDHNFKLKFGFDRKKAQTPKSKAKTKRKKKK